MWCQSGSVCTPVVTKAGASQRLKSAVGLPGGYVVKDQNQGQGRQNINVKIWGWGKLQLTNCCT